MGARLADQTPKRSRSFAGTPSIAPGAFGMASGLAVGPEPGGAGAVGGAALLQAGLAERALRGGRNLAALEAQPRGAAFLGALVEALQIAPPLLRDITLSHDGLPAADSEMNGKMPRRLPRPTSRGRDGRTSRKGPSALLLAVAQDHPGRVRTPDLHAAAGLEAGADDDPGGGGPQLPPRLQRHRSALDLAPALRRRWLWDDGAAQWHTGAQPAVERGMAAARNNGVAARALRYGAARYVAIHPELATTC